MTLLKKYALRAQPHSVLVASVEDGAAEIARLTRALAAAEADTKRLDWLGTQKYLCTGMVHNGFQWVTQIETGGDAWKGDNLRLAIDAALEDTK